MKRDLTSFLHSQLESERRARLVEQSYFKPDSPYFKLEAGRIERINAEIRRRGQSFLDWLREQKADREQRGWLPEAAAWQQRIVEVEALLADAGTSRLQAERVAEPMLRLVKPDYVAEIRRAYADDAVLLPDMLGELEAA